MPGVSIGIVVKKNQIPDLKDAFRVKKMISDAR